MQQSPKDYYKIETKEKTKVLQVANSFTVRTLKLLTKEDIFPKRARWIICYDIKELVEKFHTHVMIANGIRVDCHELFVERYKHQALAEACLYALSAKMGLADLLYGIDIDKLEKWANEFNETDKRLKNWKNADKKRYSAKYGELHEEERSAVDNAALIIGESVDVDAGRSPNPSNANNERMVNTSGALNNNNANNSNGVPAGRECASIE